MKVPCDFFIFCNVLSPASPAMHFLRDDPPWFCLNYLKEINESALTFPYRKGRGFDLTL